MLLRWVQEEEQKIAGSGDKDLFRVDEAQIDVSEGEEAVQALKHSQTYSPCWL